MRAFDISAACTFLEVGRETIEYRSISNPTLYVFMKTYELMFIVPGTFTEEDLVPHLAAVDAAVMSIEPTNVVTTARGKAKLAYPMRHIKYGYFFTVSFDADPVRVPELQRQLNLQKVLLRAIITVALGDTQTRNNAPTELITIEKKQDLIDERKKAVARHKAEETPVAAPKQVVAEPAPVAEPIKEAAPAKEAIDMEDIDKKLDQIITGDDITDTL